jgi:hypothetical protein
MAAAMRRFWTGIEKDIGSFEDFGDVDLDEIMPRSLAVLQLCIDAYAKACLADGERSQPPRPSECTVDGR